jgi:hypothetical protein
MADRVYVEFEDPAQLVNLRRGDRLYFDVEAFSVAGLLDPSGTSDESLAALSARELERDYLRRGVRTIATVTRTEWVGVTSLSFTVVLAVTGFQDPEQEVLLAASPMQWALVALAFVVAGVTYKVVAAYEGSPEAFVDVADSFSLASVAAAVVVGLVVLYLLSRK